MKPDRLESFVEENRHEFERMEPSEDVWTAIHSRLYEQPKGKIRKLGWMKVAAVIAIASVVSSAIYVNRFSARHVDPEVKELMEAEAYYSHEVSGKLAEIQKCYKVYPELKSEIEDDLNELESMYISLQKDLKENIANKEVIEAMIENNRNRMKLVDEILKQINC